MKRLFFINLLACCALGSVPVAFFYINSGHAGMKEAIKSILPSEIGLAYALLPFFLLIVFALFDKFFIQRAETTKNVVSFSLAVLSQVGSGLQGIIQALAGGLIIFPIIWMIEDPHGFRAPQGGLILFVGIMYVGLSWGISCIHEGLFTWKKSRRTNSLPFEKALLKNLRNWP